MKVYQQRKVTETVTFTVITSELLLQWKVIYGIHYSRKKKKVSEKLVDYFQSFTFKLMQKLLKMIDICLNT